jgi:hypothetical protein
LYLLEEYLGNCARRGLLAALTLAVTGSTASAQFLKVGPIIFNSSLNNSWILSSNVNGISEKEAEEQGLDREDFYTTYGFSISANSSIYPDIKLTASTSASWEEHFIQDRNAPGATLPFLGNSSFNLSRSIGHYNWTLNLTHAANTTRDKTQVPFYVPGNELLIRDIIQSSGAATSVGWNRKEITANLNYSWNQLLHTEEFSQGDSRSQNYGLSLTFSPWERFSMNYGYTSSKADLLGREPPLEGDWLQTQSLSASYRILERPSLTYTAGFEKEDDRLVIGKWEPNHSWALSDGRSVTETIDYTVNATYTFDENPEEDDINFVYGASINHSVTRNLKHALNLNRTPVETFGSTVATDTTSIGYTVNLASPIIRGASANFGAFYSRNELRGEAADGLVIGGASPVEKTMDYTASLTKSAPIPLSRKLTGSIIYSYLFTSSDARDAYDIHSITLTLGYQL